MKRASTAKSTVPINLDSEEAFALALKESENEVVVTMKGFISKGCGEHGVNEAAKVTASIKVLELLADRGTPALLQRKLEGLRHPAIDSLRDVVINGKVAAAQANAGAFLLKAIRNAAPSVWPPDVESETWKERMGKAVEMCKL